MIKIWCREFGEEDTYLWDGEIEKVFVYSHFLEVVSSDPQANGSKHEIVPLTKIDYVEFDDYDIAHKSIRIMEPVRHKQ